MRMNRGRAPRVTVRRPMAYLLSALGVLACAMAVTATSSHAYVENTYVECFNNVESNLAVLRNSMTPPDGATVQAGTPVIFSGPSEAPLTFAVASSRSLLANPDIDNGLGSAQPPTPPAQSTIYTFVSTKATATPRTVYWTASFSDAGFSGCESQSPTTHTTAVRQLTVLPSAAPEETGVGQKTPHRWLWAPP